MTAAAPPTLPTRDQVDPADCWDLSRLYTAEDGWEADFEQLKGMLPELTGYRGKLAESAATLRAYFDADTRARRILDKLYNYAHLRADEDTTNSRYRGLMDRVMGLYTEMSGALSFVRPELLSQSDEQLAALGESPELADYQFALQQIVRHKPHTLGEGEERILALASEVASAPYEAFGQLNNADMTFPSIVDENGNPAEVTHAGYLAFLSKRDRDVRKRFFDAYYTSFEAHKHTLTATLSGALKRDTFFARARHHESARHAALFDNAVPVEVYDNLVASVTGSLGAMHRYYDLRRRALKLDDVHFYDLMVPIVDEVEVHYEYDQAVDLIVASLSPLGAGYTDTLAAGLREGWVDRYENKGKRSGAYSSGCYDSDPYILMNYRADTIDSMFTLAHEAGHSMHSHLSRTHQPPQYADYSIFVAEVASTFNEELLMHSLLEQTDDPKMRAFLISKAIDDIRGTIFRQVQFADFEHRIHARAEANEPMSLDDMKGVYHEILEQYFGPAFTLDPCLDLEFLRIPHFYYNFYVFQYATGLSAAIALSQKVIAGEDGALERYLAFLSGGGSQHPIDLLRTAGVDMGSKGPVDQAMAHFARLVDELEGLLGELGQI